MFEQCCNELLTYVTLILFNPPSALKLLANVFWVEKGDETCAPRSVEAAKNQSNGYTDERMPSLNMWICIRPTIFRTA